MFLQVQNSKGQNGFVPSNYVKREKPQKPSLLDNLKKKVKHRKSSDSKTPPSPGYVEVEVDSRDSQDDLLYDHASADNVSPLNMPAVAKFRYDPAREDEISLVKGARVLVLEKSNDGWWRGECNGKTGWFPSNYVALDVDGTSDPLNGKPQTVLALFGFQARNEEELTINKGEHLELMEKPPDDPEWWKLRNEKGAVGLVPKNYVKLCESVQLDSKPPQTDSRTSSSPQGSKTPPSPGARGPPSPGARGASARPTDGAGASENRAQVMADKEFYYGKLSRTDCDNLLGTFGTPGDFLVRDSETHVSRF